MNAVQGLARQVGVAPACRALAVSRATFYRQARCTTGQQPPRKTPARTRSPSERERVRAVLYEPRFADRSPGEVAATLLDEGRYLCSERTMYRILAAEGETRERRDQLVHPSYTKPELLAERPNELWSWDISKLKGAARWEFYYLYVILDIYRTDSVLIREYGEDAALEAAQHADAMLEKGDLDGYAVWKRILRAVEELQGGDTWSTGALSPGLAAGFFFWIDISTVSFSNVIYEENS